MGLTDRIPISNRLVSDGQLARPCADIEELVRRSDLIARISQVVAEPAETTYERFRGTWAADLAIIYEHVTAGVGIDEAIERLVRRM